MQNKVSRDDLRDLMNFGGDWAVSIFMSTHRAGPETRQDPIRFKNLLRLAEHAMANRGIAEAARRRDLQPAHKLIADNDFWQHQSDGLAAYVGPGHFSTYSVPFHFAENALVDTRFQIRPLLPLSHSDGQFYLLCLSQKRVRVYVASRDEIDEIQVVGVPASIEEYMAYIAPVNAHQNRPAVPRGGGSPAAYNSHGTGSEDEKQRLREFFQQINTGLHDLLHDETAPLVLAGVDYLIPLYRDVNTYAHLHPHHLGGNPDALGPRELHQRAWTLVEPEFNRRQQEALATYQRLEGTRKTSRQLRSLIPAALGGRIATLLAAVDQDLWGTFDAATGTIKQTKHHPPPDAQELVNLTAVHTLRHGGTVYSLPSEAMPDGTPMAAIYRY